MAAAATAAVTARGAFYGIFTKMRLRRQSWVSQPESSERIVQPQFDPQQWWRFWRFRSEAMEHNFQKGSQRLAIILCNIWCVFSLGETISWMGNGLAEGAVTPTQVIYPFTVILVSLVLNNLVPTGGSAVQFWTPTPAAWAGIRRGGGRIFLIWGHYLIPRFIRSILNIHKWGEIWFYHSQKAEKQYCIPTDVPLN